MQTILKEKKKEKKDAKSKNAINKEKRNIKK